MLQTGNTEQGLRDQLYRNLGHLPGLRREIVPVPAGDHSHQSADTEGRGLDPKLKSLLNPD